MQVLDVGCGKYKRGSIGIDYSRSSDADVIADAHHLPFREEVFTRVVSYLAFEHSPNPLTFLKEQHRVLCKAGEVYFITDNGEYYDWTVFKRSHASTYDHYLMVSPKNAERMMKLASFQSISFRYIERCEQKPKRKLIKTVCKFLVKIGVWKPNCIYFRFEMSGVKKVDSSVVGHLRGHAEGCVEAHPQNKDHVPEQHEPCPTENPP